MSCGHLLPPLYRILSQERRREGRLEAWMGEEGLPVDVHGHLPRGVLDLDLVDRAARTASHLKTKGVKLNTLEQLSLQRAPVFYTTALGKKLYIMDFDWD